MGNLTNLQATTPVSEYDATKIATLNALVQILDDSIAGSLAISITTADVVLTGTPAAPQAQHLFLNVSGALTGNRAITVPVTATGVGKACLYIVKNGTSGAFTLTFKLAGGTGATIGQGSTAICFFDGTDIVKLFEVKSAGTTAMARVYHNTTQSISDVTVTALSFNSERDDTDTIHDTSSNTSRLTCKTAGIYLVKGLCGFAANATGLRAGFIRLNGSTDLDALSIPSVGASLNTRVSVSTVYRLAVNDYVEFTVYQNSGGALNTEQAGNYSPEFMMVRMGA